MKGEMMEKKYSTILSSSNGERNLRKEFKNLFDKTPIAENEILSNLGLFMNRQSLSRILFMHDLYKKIINVHGIVIEFGVRWGQNLALFQNFRGIYEPFNYNRKIVGFDTFEGFPSVSIKDGGLKVGDYSVSENYEMYLKKILEYHESESPLSHIVKFELVKGDAVQTLKKYLKDNPHTIIAMAYFDFDIYEPTQECLNLIKPHLTKGSIIAFDELNVNDFPGETIAFQEVFGSNNFEIKRSPLSPLQSWVVFK